MSNTEKTDNPRDIMQKPIWTALDADSPEVIEVLNNAEKKVLAARFDRFIDKLEDNDGNGSPDAEEFKRLIEKKQREGWTEVWTRKATRRADPREIMSLFKKWTMKQLEDDTFRLLWKKNKKVAFYYITLDKEMAEFLKTHLG